jgi:hypothetical protein
MPLPDKIRFGFSTRGKNTKQTGEAWHSPASADGSFEVFIRADQGNPLEILGILMRQLTHIAMPIEDSHGKKFKAAAEKIGLTGKMREAMPGPLLQSKLETLLGDLGPLPHASLDITWKPFEKPKVTGNRWLSATCEAPDEESDGLVICGYSVRLSAKWFKLGATCPKHGPMTIKLPDDTEASAANTTPGEVSPPADQPADHQELGHH